MGRARVLTVSTLCLLDDPSCLELDYVVDAVSAAPTRQRHDLVVAPLTPFLSFAEGKESEDLAPFAKRAAEHKTYLALALTEKAATGDTYHTSVLLDREGAVVGKYRKTHALPDDDAHALGDELPVFETDFGRIGLTISTDFYFPEVYGVLFKKGADILVWQHYPERFREHFQWVPLLKARSLDNHAHFVTAMYADPRCYLTNRYRMGMQGAAWGRSMILNRVGTAVADTGHEDGIATAVINLDRRKIDPFPKAYKAENIFKPNCMGDREAFAPVAEPWQPPALPSFVKRRARIAVGYFWDQDTWRREGTPEAMFRVLDAAAAAKPDLVLLSEMGARQDTEDRRKVMEMVAARARAMNVYLMIGGVSDKGRRSCAWLWDRTGQVVYQEPIYWPAGFPEIAVYDTDFARIGAHTCGDAYTWEIDRVLALKGAELILDPSHMWGADGVNNELVLRSHAIDNGCWLACAHWNSSDPGLRSIIVDPYGCVRAASEFQQEGVVYVDIDFAKPKVYYAGLKPNQPERGETGIKSYFSRDIPEQREGWRDMLFARRRPELYGNIPGTNEVTMRYRAN